jgi:hypothetical protein
MVAGGVHVAADPDPDPGRPFGANGSGASLSDEARTGAREPRPSLGLKRASHVAAPGSFFYVG